MDMRILFITTRFYPHIGGVENVVENLAGKMASNNEVMVINSLDINTLPGNKLLNGFKVELSQSDFVNNQKIKDKKIWINLPNSLLGYLSFPYRFVASFLALIRYIKDSKPDIINYHFPDDSSIYIWLLMIFVKTPLVVNIHGNDLHIFAKKPVHRFFIRGILKASRSVIVNSTYMKKDLSNFMPGIADRIEIISNGLDVNRFRSAKRKPEYKEFPKPYVFYIGRLVHKKGVDILLEAVKKADLPDVKFVIEGKGGEMEVLKEQVNRLEIQDQVIFTEGNINNENDEKIWVMKEAEFGVVPSRIEPFGIVALEYMAAGTPVIASKTGGLENIITDEETGLFFENGSINDLAEKMTRMFNNSELRSRLAGNASREVEKYSWENISDKYLNLYKEVCE